MAPRFVWSPRPPSRSLTLDRSSSGSLPASDMVGVRVWEGGKRGGGGAGKSVGGRVTKCAPFLVSHQSLCRPPRPPTHQDAVDAVSGERRGCARAPAAPRSRSPPSCRAHQNADPLPLPSFPLPSFQSVLLVVNGLAVLNNDRCLERWGLGHSLVGRGDGLTAGPGLLRRQVVEFLHAVTYLRGERRRKKGGGGEKRGERAW